MIDENFQVPLPSRLVGVGYPGDKRVYLRQTKGEKGAYITLSYVRGSGPSGKIPETKKSNVAELEMGILVSSLPKTFQDVITITRKLNVPYLWIDALCIIQDDKDDWIREVSQMSRIYQFSLLTVAATGAEDASKGCFLDRVPTPLDTSARVELPYRTKEGVISGKFSVYDQYASFGDEYERFVEHSPLFKRGWVFQERVLSRRMVHYTKGKMFFECRTTRFMNELLEGVEKRDTKIGFWGPEIKKGHRTRSPEQSTKNLGDPYETSTLGRWYTAVSIYSRLSLSKNEDTLVGIAGAAKEFQLLLSMERDNVGRPGAGRDGSPLHAPIYLSGLWSHDLFYGLSWYTSQPQKLQIAGDKAAPSWSWSSWHTPIEWPGPQIFKAESQLVFLGMQEHFAKSATLKINPRERLKMSALEDFETYVPRGSTSNTTMTCISTLQITGKVRTIWRKPQDANYLTAKEREEFSAACELNTQEKQWLTRCHAIYTDENASNPAGFGCFEDYWLAKSMEANSLSGSRAGLNAGLDEDQAITMLLSLTDDNHSSRTPGPGEAGSRKGGDDELERAIAESLGKAPPKKIPDTKVDLDEEFNDQLAIALMLSAEENTKIDTSLMDSEVTEASSSRDKSGKGKEKEVDKISTKPEETSISAYIEEEQAKDIQNEATLTEEADSNAGQEPASSDQTTIGEALTPAQDPEGNTALTQQLEARSAETAISSQRNTNLNSPTPHPSLTSSSEQDPTLPSSPKTTTRTPCPTSSTKGKGPNVVQAPSEPPPSISEQLQYLPSKLYCLPLFSTKARGSLGYLRLSPTVYTVLFLRLREEGDREGRKVFERIGVGRIMERGVFAGVKGEMVVLV